MLAEYFSRKNKIPFGDVNSDNRLFPQTVNVPGITFQHDDTPFWKKPNELKASKRHFRKSKVVFLVRDPRDIIVSGYFQKSKRLYLKPEEERKKEQKFIYEGSLKEYVYEEIGGIDTIIDYYNIWWSQRHQPQSFKMLRYEDLQRNTLDEMLGIMEFLEEEDTNKVLLENVISDTSFSKLHELEQEGKYPDRALTPQNENDPESFKVRRGKTGGYVDYLDDEEIAFLNEKISTRLHPIFGFSNI